MINVLVVDDHLAVRQVLRTLLERSGEVKVVGEAAGGEEALEAITALQPDVVILDVVMPGFNGYQVLKMLQQMAHRPRVVVLSVADSDGVRARALASGASAYVSKKSAHRELLPAVRALAVP